MNVESRVGSKGELFLTKELRESLGLKAGDRFTFEVKDDTLFVRRVHNLLELLAMPPLAPAETPEAIEAGIEHFFTIQEQDTVNEQ